MQTFLPYSDYQQSAQVLDNKRLGKQRVECLQILKSLTLPEYGWKNHPAVKMWRGYESALLEYSLAICDEWIDRQFNDTCRDKLMAFKTKHKSIAPPWLGDEALHASHRSNLLRKDPDWYDQFEWSEDNDLPYVWPI